MSPLERLRAACGGRVLDSEPELRARARDFGGMVERRPMAVVEAASVDDVQATLSVANELGLRVTTRGAGHSQSGQGLGDAIVLDTSALHRILSVDPEAMLVRVQAGASWRAVLDASSPHALAPCAPSHAVDTSVGGTLSVGGVGAASLEHGAHVDNVRELEVVTGDGSRVCCSPSHEPALFDAVRGGLGQCAVIVSAVYPLRTLAPELEVQPHLYRDMAALAADLDALAAHRAPDRLVAVEVRADLLAPAGLAAVLFVADARGGPARALPHVDLHSDFVPRAVRFPSWTGDALPGHPFFRSFGAERADQALHPWVDALFSLSAVPAALAAVARVRDTALRLGPGALIPIRRGPGAAPLFRTPGDDGLCAGVGVYPRFGGAHGDGAAIMGALADELGALGGVRYLSGYFAGGAMHSAADHYGPRWTELVGHKRRYDPRHVLGSPFLPLPHG